MKKIIKKIIWWFQRLGTRECHYFEDTLQNIYKDALTKGYINPKDFPHVDLLIDYNVSSFNKKKYYHPLRQYYVDDLDDSCRRDSVEWLDDFTKLIMSLQRPVKNEGVRDAMYNREIFLSKKEKLTEEEIVINEKNKKFNKTITQMLLLKLENAEDNFKFEHNLNFEEVEKELTEEEKQRIKNIFDKRDLINAKIIRRRRRKTTN